MVSATQTRFSKTKDSEFGSESLPNDAVPAHSTGAMLLPCDVLGMEVHSVCLPQGVV